MSSNALLSHEYADLLSGVIAILCAGSTLSTSRFELELESMKKSDQAIIIIQKLSNQE